MLPVPVIFLDDEAMPPQVVDYALRVRERPEVDFRWYAFPIEANNAANRHRPTWYPWAPEDVDRWIRPRPDFALPAPPTIPTEPGARVHFPSAATRLRVPTKLGSVTAALIAREALARSNEGEAARATRLDAGAR